METLKLTVCIAIGYALIFFIMALWQTRNIKDAFYEWIYTLKEWRNHAVAGLVFILVLAFIGYLIDN